MKHRSTTVAWRRRKGRKKAVEKLFGDTSRLQIRYGIQLNEDLKEFMLEVVGLISDGKLYSCSIDEGNVKIRIWITADDRIKLKWTYSTSEEEKA